MLLPARPILSRPALVFGPGLALLLVAGVGLLWSAPVARAAAPLAGVTPVATLLPCFYTGDGPYFMNIPISAIQTFSSTYCLQEEVVPGGSGVTGARWKWGTPTPPLGGWGPAIFQDGCDQYLGTGNCYYTRLYASGSSFNVWYSFASDNSTRTPVIGSPWPTGVPTYTPTWTPTPCPGSPCTPTPTVPPVMGCGSPATPCVFINPPGTPIVITGSVTLNGFPTFPAFPTFAPWPTFPAGGGGGSVCGGPGQPPCVVTGFPTPVPSATMYNQSAVSTAEAASAHGGGPSISYTSYGLPEHWPIPSLSTGLDFNNMEAPTAGMDFIRLQRFDFGCPFSLPAFGTSLTLCIHYAEIQALNIGPWFQFPVWPFEAFLLLMVVKWIRQR